MCARSGLYNVQPEEKGEEEEEEEEENEEERRRKGRKRKKKKRKEELKPIQASCTDYTIVYNCVSYKCMFVVWT